MTSESSNLSKKRKVHFVVRKFSYFDPPSNADDVDPALLFYTREEFTALKSRLITELRIIQGDGEYNGEIEVCRRGLDSQTKHGRQQRELNYRTALIAVINEQNRQRKEGVYDQDKISETYGYFSGHCAGHAASVGMADAKAARIIFREKCDDSIRSVETEIDIVTHQKDIVITHQSQKIPEKAVVKAPSRLSFRSVLGYNPLKRGSHLVKTTVE